MTAAVARRAARKGPRWLRSLLRDKLALVGFVGAALLIGMAVFAPSLAPYDPADQRILDRFAPPSAEHWLGTDEYGRDILSRVLWGSRVSLVVGLVSVGIALVAGSTLGVLAGYFGGKVDQAISWFADIVMSFPTLILGFRVVALMGPGLDNLILAIAVAVTPRFLRVARAAALTLRDQDYVVAAHALGAVERRVLLRHVVPNLLSEVTVVATLWVATAIRIEASLAFIGLGVPPPTATWGGMIREGLQYLTVASWVTVFPGLAVLVTVLAFNLIGDAMQDALDPRART